MELDHTRDTTVQSALSWSIIGAGLGRAKYHFRYQFILEQGGASSTVWSSGARIYIRDGEAKKTLIILNVNVRDRHFNLK